MIARMMDLKEWSEITKNFVEAAAFLAGGIWALYRIRTERSHAQRAGIRLSITHREKAAPRSTLIHIEVVVTNRGTVSLGLNRVHIEGRQVLPVTAQSAQETSVLKRGRSSSLPASMWPTIFEHTIVKAGMIIEPGEEDAVPFDFAVPEDLREIEVYVFCENSSRPGTGWPARAWYSLERCG